MMAKPATAPPALFPMPVSFSVEYFDPVANSLRTFVLTVFPDQRVQMVRERKKGGVNTVREISPPNQNAVGSTCSIQWAKFSATGSCSPRMLSPGQITTPLQQTVSFAATNDLLTRL